MLPDMHNEVDQNIPIESDGIKIKSHVDTKSIKVGLDKYSPIVNDLGEDYDHGDIIQW